MNERIKAIAERARLQDKGYFIYQYDGHQSVEKVLDLEVFAKMIIGVCAALAKDSTTNGINMAISQNELPEYVRGKIKEHFGVE